MSTMNAIRVFAKSGVVTVKCPLNYSFNDGARKLAGRWDSSVAAWRFDARDEDLVRALLTKWFGTDGESTPDLVSVRLTYEKAQIATRGPVTAFGWVVARASSRDSGAQMGAGAVLESGSIGSGGSSYNWVSRVDAGTTVRLRNVPRALASSTPQSGFKVEITEASRSPSNSVKDLWKERERLLHRLVAIDAALAAAACDDEAPLQQATSIPGAVQCT